MQNASLSTIVLRDVIYQWVDTLFLLIAESVTEKDFTTVGTMRLDSQGIPKEIKEIRNRDKKSALHGYQRDANGMLVSYLDKKVWKA